MFMLNKISESESESESNIQNCLQCCISTHNYMMC